ncbi:hypothetical protein QBC39DRAFT_343319 [Podospora conica]|nr:hypothetical protein QBC39DRAFT_343319 [Schizothecium conicum]
MIEVLGSAATIVGILNAALSVINEIRIARERIKGSSKTLKETSARLNQLESSLTLIRAEPPLRTADIEAQVSAIALVTTELKAFFARLVATQDRSRMARYRHQLRAGDREDRELQDILTRLDRERDELALRIGVVHVQQMGGLQGGFETAARVLEQTHGAVREMAGRMGKRDSGVVVEVEERDVGLEWTRQRGIGQAGSVVVAPPPWRVDQRTPLRGLAPAPLELEQVRPKPAPQMSVGDAVNSGGLGRRNVGGPEGVWIHDNLTKGKASIMTGNVGIEGGRKATAGKTTLAHNQFHGDLKFMAGDIGGEAAKGFNNFWN